MDLDMFIANHRGSKLKAIHRGFPPSVIDDLQATHKANHHHLWPFADN